MSSATHFFLGANSGLGFQNLFVKFCETGNYHDLLLLKGGPGCGKSTMMKKIGEAMEARGEQVEYLHCSGDPDSLDGVHIPRIAVAVLDATSPHALEPRYPAAVDRYVDLGQFYDLAQAKRERGMIMHRTNAYKEAYRSAYRNLRAARELENQLTALMLSGLDLPRLMKRTEGIITREIRGKGSGMPEQFRFLGGLTHQGFVMRYDSVVQLCPRVYHLLDSDGLAAPMLERIAAAARERRYGAICCPDAERPEKIQHLLIPELGVAFVTTKGEGDCCGEPYRRLHIDEMVDPEHRKRWRGKRRLTNTIIQTLREEGVEFLRQAKREHDLLEALYHPGLDLDGINELTRREIERISGY